MQPWQARTREHGVRRAGSAAAGPARAGGAGAQFRAFRTGGQCDAWAPIIQGSASMHDRAALAALHAALMLQSCSASCEDAAPANTAAVPAWALPLPLVHGARLLVHCCVERHPVARACTAVRWVQCLLALTHRSIDSGALKEMLLRRRRWQLFTQ